MTSSLSNLVNIRRKAFSLLNNRERQNTARLVEYGKLLKAFYELQVYLVKIVDKEYFFPYA